MNKKIKFITLGCKANQSETESLAHALALKGYEVHDTGNQADLVVINTCAVTGRAAMQSRQEIRKAARKYPGARIIVTGCYAQSGPKEIASIPGVDTIVSQSRKERLLEIITLGSTNQGHRPEIYHEKYTRGYAFSDPGAPAWGFRSRPFVKIQDGCNSFCSYCIVPYTRGPSRSRDPKSVISEIRYLEQKGAKEVVLVGIHIGRYGMDLTPAMDLEKLLQQILSDTRIHRIRLSSIEPTELTDSLIELAASSERICNHFHVPLQSGDDGILAKMRRPYTADFFGKRIKFLRSALPDAAIGADIMVGFPGETDQAFENSLGLVSRLPLTYLHVFPFSPRPQAPASDFPMQVPPEIKKNRAKRLRLAGIDKKAEFFKNFKNRCVEVLIERPGKEAGSLSGLSANYIPVKLKGPDSLIGKIVQCRITETSGTKPVSAELVL